jgi:hypothetical protein
MVAKRLVVSWLGALALGMILTVSSSAQDFLLNDDNGKATHNCEGGKALINGNHNNVKLQDCQVIQVNGNENVIEALGPTHLDVFGNANDIAWTRKSENAKAPTVANVGSNNKVHEKKR